MVKPVPNKWGFKLGFNKLGFQPWVVQHPGLKWGVVGALGGLAMAIATPPVGLWPLAWIALVPLWMCLLGTDPPPDRLNRLRAPARIGATLAWAWVYNGVTLRWIFGLHPLTWLGVPEGPSRAIALLCWIAVTVWGSLLPLLWMGAMGWLQSRIHQPWALIAAGTGLWCAIDWGMSCSPLYWNPIALSQSPGNPMILHLGRWGGPLWITAVLVAVNGLLACFLGGPRRLPLGRRSQRERLGPESRDSTRSGWLALALLLGVHGLGAVLMGGAAPVLGQPGALTAETAQESLRLGIIQGNVPTRIKLTPKGQAASIDRYLNGYGALALAGVDAVLMPEGALPFVLEEAIAVTEDLNDVFAQVRQTRPRPPVAWVGAFGFQEGHYTQSLFGFDPAPQREVDTQTQGQTGTPIDRPIDLAITPRYDKVKLVPLGEYIPLASTLGAVLERLSPLPQGMRPGDFGQRFQTPWGLAAVEICYEPAFSAVVRRQVAQGARFILSSSNLDPYSEVLMAQSEAHDVMRAIETDRWIARATNTGYSGFITPHGQVIGRSPAHEQVRLVQSIGLRQSTTPYVRWGGWTSLPLFMLPCLVWLGSTPGSKRWGPHR